VQYKGADPAKVLPNYDYDVIDEYALTHRVSVKDGRIVLPEGTSYAMLVLPNRPSISLAALRTVQKLAGGGAAILGPKPQRTTGIGDDAAVREIADVTWPKVRTGQTARAVLESLHVAPDYEGPAETDYVHRRAGGTEIYFIRSNRPEPMSADFTLRVKGKTPELWHSDSGRIEAAPAWTTTSDGRTRLPLSLEPNGSVFVVFRREGPASKAAPAPVPAPKPVAVAGPWKVRFTPGWGAPAEATFDTLRSWTESSEPGIKFYSGTARYSTRVNIPAGTSYTLDLGEVREIAEVWLNGKPLGVLWKKPFAVALGGAAKAGENELEVEVVNLWPNRLIGDQQLPAEQRRTSTNITKFTATSPLMPSGLLGPVVLR